MSRIGRKPIEIPSGVTVELSGQTVTVRGPKGTLCWDVPEHITVQVEGGTVRVQRDNDERPVRALHGLTRALIANMITGVTQGYSKTLELYGTGYSCKLEGGKLLINCGYMGLGVGRPAQFIIDVPEGIEVSVEVQAARGNNEPARFTISGIDKQKVGQFAAEIRALRKPEPYLGKGIRYAGEQIRRKAGKVFAGGG